MQELVQAWITHYGYLAIFLLLMFGIVGLPVPDEWLLTFTGYFVFKGHLTLPLAFGAALAGSISGITISYWLGRTFGISLIHRYGKYLRIQEDHLHKAHAWFERVGHWGLTFGYFVPGVRHFTAYAAGMSELEPHHFAAYAYSGAVLWVCTFVSLGYFLGERWETVERDIHRYMVWAAAGLAMFAVAYWMWWRATKKSKAARP
jgi:membrane protein DedA with SNARE-associated domain